jgi:hypothetical protein
MKKVIVNFWTEVPFIGLQISKFSNPKDAFNYAEKEFLIFGYNVAYYSTDINTLFLTKK